MKSFSVLVLFLSLSVSAQIKTLPLWPEGKIPNYQKSDEKEEIDINTIKSEVSPF